MSKFEFKIDQNGKVNNPIGEIKKALIELQEGLKAELYPYQARAVDLLILLLDRLPYVSNGEPAAGGWDSFIDEFHELEDLLGEVSIEVDKETWYKAKALLAMKMVGEPTLTMTTMLSRIILDIPFPD